MTGSKGPGTQLDATQYRAETIARYEAVYGQHFISPGGADSVRWDSPRSRRLSMWMCWHCLRVPATT